MVLVSAGFGPRSRQASVKVGWLLSIVCVHLAGTLVLDELRMAIPKLQGAMEDVLEATNKVSKSVSYAPRTHVIGGVADILSVCGE